MNVILYIVEAPYATCFFSYGFHQFPGKWTSALTTTHVVHYIVATDRSNYIYWTWCSTIWCLHIYITQILHTSVKCANEIAIHSHRHTPVRIGAIVMHEVPKSFKIIFISFSFTIWSNVSFPFLRRRTRLASLFGAEKNNNRKNKQHSQLRIYRQQYQSTDITIDCVL